ncbi:hypothetical protein ACQKGC_23840 [Allorhizobium pseudoryzae]
MSYPKGAAGLYGSGFVRYGYAICEAFPSTRRMAGSGEAETRILAS